MADAKVFNVKGTNYNIIDQTARSNAEKALTNAEYDRQEFNGIYAGRNLNSLFSGQSDLYAYLGGLCDSGFGDLRIGDYFTVPVESSNLTVRIAGMDTYLNAMDTQLTQHHLVCLFDPIAITDPDWQTTDGQYLYWGDTASNQGTEEEKHPYLNSNLHKWETEWLFPKLPQALRNRIIDRRCLLEERYSSSESLTESSDWSWVNLGKIWSLNEMEVYGAPVWGTKGYSVGESCQLPIFRQTKDRVKLRVPWWLRSVMGGSASNVCYCNNNGNANNNSPRNTWVRPRPGFPFTARPSKREPKAERKEEGRRDHRPQRRKYAPRAGSRTLLAWPGAPALSPVPWPPRKAAVRAPMLAVRGALHELRRQARCPQG